MCTTTPDAELQLPMTDGSVARARTFLREAACGEHTAAVVDRAVLLVSELVTNGIRYGAPPVIVAVACDGTRGLVVTVTDHAPALPRPRPGDPRAEGGHGLNLVDYVSDDWGVDPRSDSKAVWFSLATA